MCEQQISPGEAWRRILQLTGDGSLTAPRATDSKLTGVKRSSLEAAGNESQSTQKRRQPFPARCLVATVEEKPTQSTFVVDSLLS